MHENTNISLEASKSAQKKLRKRLDRYKDMFTRRRGKFRSERALEELCEEGGRMVAKEPVLIDVAGEMWVVGDIHGQLADMLNIFKEHGTPPVTKYLFMGDYVDRGQYGLECLAILLSLKIFHPNEIFLLRGNHEDAPANENYGFKYECISHFSVHLVAYARSFSFFIKVSPIC